MDILILPPRTLTIACTSAAAGEQVVELMARLALQGPLTILDGGNCFPAYRLLRALRARTGSGLPAVMKRVFVRRAFTCHQMLALLEGAASLPQPHLLLDMLVTFYDEQVPLPETSRLLDGCLRQVERLAQNAPVLVTITPPRTPERADFIERVSARASRVYLPEQTALPAAQPALF